MLHVIQIVLKGKRASQWFDLKKQFVDANKIRDFFAMNSNLRIRFHELIKGSIEPTHGSVCSGVRKFQSMNVLKLLSTNLKRIAI